MRRLLLGLVLIAGAFSAASGTSSAGIIKLDSTDYTMQPGENLIVQVMVGITESQVNAANVGFRVEAVPMAGASGTLTTSLGGVSESPLSPYIFSPNAGFFNTGSGGLIATGGDNTSDGFNDLLTNGDYYLSAVTWSASSGADGDFLLRFGGLGTVTILSDPNDNNFLTQGVSSVVHVVPEPTTLALFSVAVALLARRRTRPF